MVCYYAKDARVTFFTSCSLPTYSYLTKKLFTAYLLGIYVGLPSNCAPEDDYGEPSYLGIASLFK